MNTGNSQIVNPHFPQSHQSENLPVLEQDLVPDHGGEA